MQSAESRCHCAKKEQIKQEVGISIRPAAGSGIQKRTMKIHPLITTTAALADLCKRLAKSDFVTVDTEFMRENTFWPELCLVQIANEEEAAAIDPLARSSLCSSPGSRKWTCVSMTPGVIVRPSAFTVRCADGASAAAEPGSRLKAALLNIR